MHFIIRKIVCPTLLPTARRNKNVFLLYNEGSENIFKPALIPNVIDF